MSIAWEMEEIKKEDFECPVCFNIPSKEIYQCKNGHIICDSCIIDLPLCPVCRVSLGETKRSRNRFMESILDHIKFDCPLSDRGCKERMKRADFDKHKSVCKFGISLDLCKILGHPSCTFKLNIANSEAAAQHLKTQHNCPSFVRTTKTRFRSFLVYEDFGKYAISKNVKSATWYFLLEDQHEKKIFVIFCKTKKDLASWLCLDLKLQSFKFVPKASTSEWLDVAMHVQSSLGGTSLRWQIPYAYGTEKELRALMEDPPFKISLPYLIWRSNTPEGILTTAIIGMEISDNSVSNAKGKDEVKPLKIAPHVEYKQQN